MEFNFFFLKMKMLCVCVCVWTYEYEKVELKFYFLALRNRRRRVVMVTFPRGFISGVHWMGDLFFPRVGLDAMVNSKYKFTFSLPTL
jgi:hypothetical protein